MKAHLKLILILILSFSAGFFLLQWIPKGPSSEEIDFENKNSLSDSSSTALDDPQLFTVSWNHLRELNLETGEMSESLKTLNQKKIRIPGFMVPLEDDQKKVTEFLLVPSPQACIHVPPPPPNQMLMVKIPVEKAAEVAYGPIWVTGILEINPTESPYGKVSYLLQAESIKPYKKSGSNE